MGIALTTDKSAGESVIPYIANIDRHYADTTGIKAILEDDALPRRLPLLFDRFTEWMSLIGVEERYDIERWLGGDMKHFKLERTDGTLRMVPRGEEDTAVSDPRHGFSDASGTIVDASLLSAWCASIQELVPTCDAFRKYRRMVKHLSKINPDIHVPPLEHGTYSRVQLQEYQAKVKRLTSAQLDGTEPEKVAGLLGDLWGITFKGLTDLTGIMDYYQSLKSDHSSRFRSLATLSVRRSLFMSAWENSEKGSKERRHLKTIRKSHGFTTNAEEEAGVRKVEQYLHCLLEPGTGKMKLSECEPGAIQRVLEAATSFLKDEDEYDEEEDEEADMDSQHLLINP